MERRKLQKPELEDLLFYIKWKSESEVALYKSVKFVLPPSTHILLERMIYDFLSLPVVLSYSSRSFFDDYINLMSH